MAATIVEPQESVIPFDMIDGRFQCRSIEPAFALEELSAVGFDVSYREAASTKYHPLVLKLHDIPAPAMNILKQECITVGAEAGVHREAITCKIERGAVLITATESQLTKLITRLAPQPFGLSALAQSLTRWLLRRNQLREIPVRSMAIVNVTPDSFSDGRRFDCIEDILQAVQEAVSFGVDVLDIGGESTRPGATVVDEMEELKRVVPVIEAIHQAFPQVKLSVDTRKASVAKAALVAGAHWVNDVSGGHYDPSIIEVVSEHQCPYIITHAKGIPETMHQQAHYDNMMDEIVAYFYERIEWALLAGVLPENVLLDPGFGFAKTLDHNLTLLRRLPEITSLGFPVVVGTSRKQFLTLGQPEDIPTDQREALTAATTALALQSGAKVLRIHNVKTQLPVIQLLKATLWPSG